MKKVKENLLKGALLVSAMPDGNSPVFHNTTNLTGSELKTAKQKALSQNKLILQFFKRNKRSVFTPCQIHRYLFENKKVPITSVRRAISDLTEGKKLIRLDKKKIGAYGRLVYVWKFNETFKINKEPKNDN